MIDAGARPQLHCTITSGSRPAATVKLVKSALTFPHDIVINGHMVISSECLPCEIVVNEHGGVTLVEE